MFYPLFGQENCFNLATLGIKQPFSFPTIGNICSVGLESECPGIGKIEGELFIPRENFSFSEIGQLSKPSAARFWQSRSRKRKSSIEEWKVSLRFFHIPGPLTFQPYRCIFSICGASTYHKSSSKKCTFHALGRGKVLSTP